MNSTIMAIHLALLSSVIYFYCVSTEGVRQIYRSNTTKSILKKIYHRLFENQMIFELLKSLFIKYHWNCKNFEKTTMKCWKFKFSGKLILPRHTTAHLFQCSCCFLIFQLIFYSKLYNFVLRIFLIGKYLRNNAGKLITQID